MGRNQLGFADLRIALIAAIGGSAISQEMLSGCRNMI